MIPIIKSSIPRSLIAHKQEENASYDNIPSDVKNELKESLLGEQRGICAYCMCRIRKETMHIEHWHPQSICTEKELEYDNMLAVCDGIHYENNLYTCDKQKANRTISFNPAKRSDHARLKIKYKRSGEIISEDNIFNSELNDKLNLNNRRLKLNRKDTLDSFTAYINKLCTTKSLNREQLERIAKDYCFDGENLEYRGIIDYYVAKKSTA